jgi:hypothetical protein
MAFPRGWSSILDACGVIPDARGSEKRYTALPPYHPVLGCDMQRMFFCLLARIGIIGRATAG